jgi:hypothetical protein
MPDGPAKGVRRLQSGAECSDGHAHGMSLRTREGHARTGSTPFEAQIVSYIMQKGQFWEGKRAWKACRRRRCYDDERKRSRSRAAAPVGMRRAMRCVLLAAWLHLGQCASRRIRNVQCQDKRTCCVGLDVFRVSIRAASFFRSVSKYRFISSLVLMAARICLAVSRRVRHLLRARIFCWAARKVTVNAPSSADVSA